MDGTFLAIDFETASASRASACAVGVALFEGGQIRESAATLIDPLLADEQWDDFNTMIHGIRSSDVVGAPSFSEAWAGLQGTYPGVPLVAHNAGFDMSVLRAEIGRAGVSVEQPLRYTCSASIARIAWPEMLSVSLPIVAEALGISLDHHEPISDARASGEILTRAASVLGASSVDDALTRANRRWGEIHSDLTWDTGYMRQGGGGSGPRAKDFVPDASAEFDEQHPLYGATVVFTGTLQSMTRREAYEAIVGVGAQPGDTVTKRTNVLVVGEQDLARLVAGEQMSSKQVKAAALREAGQDIQMVGEIELLRML
jgi:DNA polymerase-3 subunit epsilon